MAAAPLSETTLWAMARWLVVLTIFLGVVLHAHSVKVIVLGGVASLVVLGYVQFYVWDDWKNGLFASHWMYMIILLRAGTEALRGDGYPISVHPALGIFAALALGYIAFHETIVTHLHMFHNYVHMTIYISGMFIALCASSQRSAGWLFGTAAALRVRAVRQFLDPCLYFAIGMLLLGHQHDPAPLAIGLHSTFGWNLVALAVSCFLCSLMHDVHPAEHPAAATMRSVHALAWILTGGITYTMCVVKYLTQRGGFSAYLTSHGIQAQSDFEELSMYIAATFLGCGLHLALLHASTRSSTAATSALAASSARASSALPKDAARDEMLPMVHADERAGEYETV